MADGSALEQLSPIVVTAGVGLVSVYLGQLWGRRHSDESWLREQRLAAYTTVLDESQAMWSAATKLFNLPWPHSPARPGLVDELNLHRLALGRHQAVIDLLGPPAAKKALDKWRADHTALATLVCKQALCAPAQAAHPERLTATVEGKAMAAGEKRFTEAAKAALIPRDVWYRAVLHWLRPERAR